jgi:addiction module RelB/DinJ family antitoxin
MEMVTISFEVDSELLKEAEKIFSRYGLSVEEACILFIKETIKCGKIPFDYTEEDLKAAKKEG